MTRSIGSQIAALDSLSDWLDNLPATLPAPEVVIGSDGDQQLRWFLPLDDAITLRATLGGQWTPEGFTSEVQTRDGVKLVVFSL